MLVGPRRCGGGLHVPPEVNGIADRQGTGSEKVQRSFVTSFLLTGGKTS